MKKTCWLLIVTILLGCLAACQGTESSNGDQLTKSQKEEIDRAWDRLGYLGYGEWYDDGFAWGPRYYGTESGYLFLFIQANLCIGGRVVIGGLEFKSGQSFNLYAYKDGVFHLLSTLYHDGTISDSTLESIWKEHQRIEAEIEARNATTRN